jgi:hypothetical protein
MRLRIVRPLPVQIEGVDLSAFRFGAAYDIKAPLCDLLLTLGYGIPADELRDTANDAPPRRKRSPRLRSK